MLLALLVVSLARESPSCCDWLRRIQDSQARAEVTGLRKRVLRRENSLMRHALRVTRKAVFLFALFTVAAVWSRPVTAQPARPRETPASPEQQAQDVQQLKAKLQQLEQMMDEMKGKLNELEGQPASNHASESGPSNSLVSAVTPLNASPTAHSTGAAGTPLLGKQPDQKKSGSESTMDV